MTFVWEDWNKKHSRSQKRSLSVVCTSDSGSPARVQLRSSKAQKAAAAAGISQTHPRSIDENNSGRCTSKHLHYTSHASGSVQVMAKQAEDFLPVSKPQPSGSEGLHVKLVQSRGTQLDSTPIHFTRSPLALQHGDHVPSVIRQLEQMPMEKSVSLAWKHYSSPSVAKPMKHAQQLETSPGNKTELLIKF